MEKERWIQRKKKSRLNSQIKRRVSQRCIHSSKVTDPHPRLLLRAKCSTEKSDEQREREDGAQSEEEPPPPTSCNPLPKSLSLSKENSTACIVIFTLLRQKTQAINKSTKLEIFKYHVIMPHCTVREQKLEYAFRKRKEEKNSAFTLCAKT